ncbi:HNH endonuclease [Aliidiomarina sedimenti]|nr:HNH endonuclease [Aliidiomarina sedimenti]
MLFAVMDLIEDGSAGLNGIYYNDELKNRFAWYFEKFRSSKDQLNTANPFFYLRSSSFWHHAIHVGKQVDYGRINTPSDKSINQTIAYAYLDDELFFFLKDATTAAVLRNALVENLDTREEGFKRWALSIGKTEKTVANYTQALKTSIPNWLSDAGQWHTNLLSISDYFALVRVMDSALKVQEFVDYNKRGKGMYLAALKMYRAYLDELTDATAQHDVEVIEQDTSLEPTVKSSLVQARRGQGKFRRRLIDSWQRCAVTGYDNISLLLASHIKPWSSSDNKERLDPFNGLLLIPNLDKAFDLNYVSFDEKGKILISDQLGEYQSLGIHDDMTVPLYAKHQEYMAFHREVFHKKGI